MNRKAIHEQIAALVDKLSFLNERLADEQNLHPVELDLLNGYSNELQGLVKGLGASKAELHIVKEEPVAAPLTVVQEKREPVHERKITPAAEVKPEPVAEKKPDAELKMHQHILEKAETAKIPEDPEAFLEEEKITSPPPPVKMEAPEEILVRKKGAAVKQEEKEGVSLNDRLKKETVALADKLKGAKKKKLKDIFALNERYAFIESLFGGSAEQFNRAIQELGKCASREEAEQYIKNVESKFAWQEKPDLAKRFSGQVLEMIG